MFYRRILTRSLHWRKSCGWRVWMVMTILLILKNPKKKLYLQTEIIPPKGKNPKNIKTRQIRYQQTPKQQLLSQTTKLAPIYMIWMSKSRQWWRQLMLDLLMAKDMLLPATSVERTHHPETCLATSKPTISLVSPILVTCVEKFRGQEMHLGCIRIKIIESNFFRTKHSLVMHKFRQHHTDWNFFTGPGMA